MLRRAQVVAFSGQGMQAKHIAKQLCLHEEYVRELIRRFDAGSFEALKPKRRTGRPRDLEPEEAAQVVEIATMRPKDFGLPLTTWSLRKLADFLVARRMVAAPDFEAYSKKTSVAASRRRRNLDNMAESTRPVNESLSSPRLTRLASAHTASSRLWPEHSPSLRLRNAD